MRSYIDDRPERILSQWWMNPRLHEAAQVLIKTQCEVAHRLSESYKPSKAWFFPDGPVFYQWMQQPVASRIINKARAAYVDDQPHGEVPPDYDSLAHPDRACLSNYHWFAAMWQTWSMVGLCERPNWYQYSYSEHRNWEANAFLDNIHNWGKHCFCTFDKFSEKASYENLVEERKKYTIPNTREAIGRIQDDCWSKEKAYDFKVQDHWTMDLSHQDDDLTYNSIRRTFIEGYSNAYTLAMSCLPQSIQQDLQNNVYELFDYMEHVTTYTCPSQYYTHTPIIEHIVSSNMKMWWGEFYDQYVHGIPASFPFNYIQRRKDIIKATSNENGISEYYDHNTWKLSEPRNCTRHDMKRILENDVSCGWGVRGYKSLYGGPKPVTMISMMADPHKFLSMVRRRRREIPDDFMEMGWPSNHRVSPLDLHSPYLGI